MAAVTPLAPFSSATVLTGSIAFYSAPVGTAFPSMPSMGSALVVPSPWTQFGYTDAGVKWSYTPTNKGITADEAMSDIKVLKTGEALKVSAALKEGTLENIQRALSGAIFTDVVAGAAQAEIATIDVGGSALYQEFALLLVQSIGPYGFPRYYGVYRSMATANVEMAFKKDEAVMVPLEFTGLTYTPNAIGKQLFQIVEKRANATS